MTAIIQFTPLYGTDVDSPCCYLLKIDEYHLLLDCGWDDTQSEELLTPVKKIITDIDAVILSHPDLTHLGALPYVVGKLGLSCPIYCTLPVWKMGQMFIYDQYQSRSEFQFGTESAVQYSLDDVDAAFDRCIQLKYQQEVTLSGRGTGITITPYAAGHMIGGTIWRITKETETIVYANTWNHRMEKHLKGTVLDSDVFYRPTLLITDCYNALPNPLTSHLHSQGPKKKHFEQQQLTNAIAAALERGGNVLLPVDAAGRVLELLLVLQNWWETKQPNATIAFLSHEGYNTVEFAKTQLEWMSDAVMRAFDQDHVTSKPYDFRALKLCHNKRDLDALPKPYVVLATSYTLETSFAQDVLIELSSNPRNLILLTSRAPSHTLASRLLSWPPPKTITFSRRKNVMLQGDELIRWQEQQQLEKNQKALETTHDVTEDEDEDLTTPGGTGVGVMTSGDLNVQWARWKQELKAPSFLMYPHTEPKHDSDLYGEMIDPDEYSLHPKPAVVKQEEMMDTSTTEEVKENIPRKTVVEQVTIEFNARIAYVDYEGRADSRSIKTILSHVQPRKLILIHGTDAGKEELRTYCLKNVCKEVIAPISNQLVDITSETNLYRVNLKDQLLQSLKFVQVGDYELAYAEGELRIAYDQSGLPLLDSIPRHLSHGHPAVFLGEVKFSDLKRILNQHGITAEFYGGILVCENGLVNIRKISSTQISIKGAISTAYYKIRSLLYDQYEII